MKEFIVQSTWKHTQADWWNVAFTGGVKAFSNLFEASKAAKRLSGDLFTTRVICQGVVVWPEPDTAGFERLQEKAAERIAEDYYAGEFDQKRPKRGDGPGDGVPHAPVPVGDAAEPAEHPAASVSGGEPSLVPSDGGKPLSGTDSRGADLGRPYYGTLSPEPIDVIEGWNLGYNRGNAIKYIARAGRKSNEGAEECKDLRKAISYLQREVNRLDGKSGW